MQVKSTILWRWLLRKELHVPWKGPAELESMMKAHTTDRENTETQVFSAYISIASVKEKRALLSAQLRSLSASAAYSALPLNDKERRNKGETIKSRINYNCDKWISNGKRNFSALATRPWEFSPLKAAKELKTGKMSFFVISFFLWKIRRHNFNRDHLVRLFKLFYMNTFANII